MNASSRVGLALVLVALLACKEGDSGKCDGDSDCGAGKLCHSGVCLAAADVEKLRTETPKPEPQPAGTPSPIAPTVATPPPVEATADPRYAGIGMRSSPPSVPEWNSQTREVDVRHSTPLRCETKLVREWLRVSCRGDDTQGVRVVQRAGLLEGEVFVYERAGSVASLVLPIRGSMHLEAEYSWTWGVRRLTVKHDAGAPLPQMYFDAPR